MAYILDSTAQDTWRDEVTSVEAEYLFLHAPAVVFKAQLVVVGIVPYPQIVLFYDNVTAGDYTDLREDQILLLGSTDGGDEYGRVRIRRNFFGNVSSDVAIFIQRSSQGILDGEINLVDDAYITVLDFYPIWSIPPLIETGGQLFKDTELPFDADYNLLPVANVGIDQLHVVENINDTVNIDCGEWASYATAPGETIDTYLWEAPDGQTSTDPDPTFTIAADTVGYVHLTVTDTAGNSVTGRRLWVVVNKNHANLFRNFELQPLTAGINGQTASVIIHDSIPVSTYPNGTECLITMRENYGGTVGTLVGSPGAEHMLISGWIGSEDMRGEWSERGYLHSTTLQLLDSAGRMRLLPGFTQLIERESDPTHWGQMAGANLDRYLWHLGYWHSNVFRRVDFLWSGTGETYAFSVLGSDAGSLFDQLALRARAIRHELTCDRYGRLRMLPDPQLQAESDRTSDVIVSVREADWQSLQRRFDYHPRHHWQFGEKVVASTTDAADVGDISTVFTLAPGQAPGLGLSAFTAGGELVMSQLEANRIDGARYRARTNARESTYQVQLTHLGYVVDTALMKWVRFEVTSETAGVRGRTVPNTTRFLVTEIQYTYNPQDGTRVQRWTLEREGVNVIDAVTDVRPDVPGFTPPTSPIYPTPSPVTVINPSLILTADTTSLWHIQYRDYSAGEFSLITTEDSYQTETETTAASMSIPGVHCEAQQDPFNPTRLYEITDEAAGLITDIAGTPGWTIGGGDANGLGLAMGDTPISIRIHTNIARQNFVFGVVYASNGSTTKHYIVKTLDGVNWSSALYASTTVVSVIWNALAWVSAHRAGTVHMADFSGTAWRILRSDDYGGTWSALPNIPISAPILGFHFPYANNADDEHFFFSTFSSSGGGSEVSFWEYDHGTVTNLDTDVPNTTTGNANIGGIGLRGIDTFSGDPNVVAMIGLRFGHSFPTGWGLDVLAGGYTYSNDGGGSWSPASVGNTRYRGIAISGNDPNVRWTWGAGGLIEKTIDGVNFTNLRDDGVGALMDNGVVNFGGLP